MLNPSLWFLLSILFLPTQLGRHFWPDFSIVSGLQIDYLSPTIYFTDILVVLLLLSFALPFFPNFTKNARVFNKNVFVKRASTNASKFQIILFVAWLTIGIFLSESPMAGLYGLLKFFEFLFLGLFIAKALNIERMWEKIVFFFALGVLFESFLATFQFLNQSSVGGVFWFFGERTFTGQTPGIANAVLDGQLILRPYGTFPHPNVLAGYLTIGLVFIMYNLRFKIYDLRRAFFIGVLVLGTVALFLTLSRVAIFLWFLQIGIWFVIRFGKIFRKNLLILLVLLALMIIGVTSIFLATPLGDRFRSPLFLDESVLRRKELVEAAFLMIRSHPFFGVGLNNFLVNLPLYQTTQNLFLYLQPVHNLYLLIAAETGIIGLGFFFWFIIKTFKRLLTINKFSIALLLILILGMFDHYFLTLQQGQLLFALVLGLCWAKER